MTHQARVLPDWEKVSGPEKERLAPNFGRVSLPLGQVSAFSDGDVHDVWGTANRNAASWKSPVIGGPDFFEARGGLKTLIRDKHIRASLYYSEPYILNHDHFVYGPHETEGSHFVPYDNGQVRREHHRHLTTDQRQTEASLTSFSSKF